MEPLEPYLVRKSSRPDDIFFYECHSIKDYVRSKNNEKKFPRGSHYELVAIIRGSYTLAIGRHLLTDEKMFLNGYSVPSGGFNASLSPALVREEDKARLFILQYTSNLLNFCPVAGHRILTLNPLIWYPRPLEGKNIQGFYVSDWRDEGLKRWMPQLPSLPAK